MTRTGAMTLFAGLLLLATSGCGTMLNVNGMERFNWASLTPISAESQRAFEAKYHRPAFPFGGVANDIAWIKTAEEPLDILESLVDLPLSLGADIVTLPWTIRERLRYRGVTLESVAPLAALDPNPFVGEQGLAKTPVADARGSLIR